MTKKIKWPKVSFILLTLNGGQGVRDCLEAVKKQDYPKELIDVVVVDNGSKDESVKIAKSLGARVFINPKGTLYSNWVVGLHKTRGEFVFYLEQDIELRGSDFIKNMVKPMLLDDRLIATFTKEWPDPKMHWVVRYLSYHYCQCDPLLEFLFLPLKKAIVENKKEYFVCEYKHRKIQPAVRMFYRIKYLKKTPNWTAKNYFDHDFAINCVKSGYRFFGYVPEPGYFHYHVRDFRHLLQKRMRNMGMHYFPEYGKYKYTILDTGNKKEVFRFMLFIIYANLFFPAAIRGFFRFLKHKDWTLLTEPVITIAVTDTLLYTFLGNKTGRKYITDSLLSLVR